MQSTNTENILNHTIPQEKTDQRAEVIIDVEATKAIPEGEIKEDPNWKAFREARKQDRILKEAAEKKAAEKEQEVLALRKAMEAAFAKQPVIQQNHDSYYPQEETEDERIQKKVDAALAARDEQYQREAQEREAREYPQRLNQTYPDFNQVITDENLDWLDHHYPEISRPFQRLPNDYQKWSDIYQTVKKLIPNYASVKKDAQRAESNLQKPQSMSAIGNSQIPQQQGASILGKERRKQNWERMQRTLKGLT